ncbi:tyrosine-type recombinase/integrase [Streptomyces sp. WI04-05B]|uniref:tyrosine-type recombinase/integrase n=1 Tax=Streptomyces TaxID=1883 RepID=UPI0029AAA64D|nr:MULTISPECIES: tyrosine-type recombinase/integrase [unclassified Streptomyces]MDX2545843.1 tyrosine-type recombinase/integrase [Streptomyces sp. WI04-05B]MDX2586402.1 tyrosine-type recombinase/integrase [Streptomyces sp. WI04-05A]
MATSGWIEDRWLKKRPNPETGKRERTALYGKCMRYRVAGIPGIRKRSFETLDEAKNWKAKAITDTKKKEFVDDRDGEILLGDYVRDEWWPKRDDPVNTVGPMKSKVFNHIVATQLGRTPMNVIDDGHLVEWKRELKGRGLAPATIEVIWNHLSSIFKAATGKRIAKNPCLQVDRGVRPSAGRGSKARAWTREEAHSIRRATPERYRIIADLGMHAGQRQAETFGFSPDDIDRELMVLHVRRQLLWENGLVPFFKLPKGDKERDIPLSPGLLKLLDAYADGFAPKAVTLPWEGPGNDGKDKATVRLLVVTDLGNRLNPSTFNSRTVKPTLARAGLIAPKEKGKVWGWEASREMMHHRWRHTYASVQLGAGEDVISVSHWMGHASPDITLKTYAHFMPDCGVRGRTAVDNWLESGATPRPAAADLRAVEPYAFTETMPLSLPGERLKDPVETYVQGARYAGGPWTVGAVFEAGGPIRGEIRTDLGDDSDRAVAAGLAWLKEYCAAEGLALVKAENLNSQVAEPLRPYQALGRFLLEPVEGVRDLQPKLPENPLSA